MDEGGAILRLHLFDCLQFSSVLFSFLLSLEAQSLNTIFGSTVPSQEGIPPGDSILKVPIDLRCLGKIRDSSSNQHLIIEQTSIDHKQTSLDTQKTKKKSAIEVFDSLQLSPGSTVSSPSRVPSCVNSLLKTQKLKSAFTAIGQKLTKGLEKAIFRF